jgi:TRAP-type C4-dicarboxylate transport system permease small subunit
MKTKNILALAVTGAILAFTGYMIYNSIKNVKPKASPKKESEEIPTNDEFLKPPSEVAGKVQEEPKQEKNEE